MNIAPGADVVWSQRRKTGGCIVYSKYTGRVLSVDGEVATVQRRGNNHRVKVHVSRLVLKSEDTPTSLTERAKRDLGIG